MKLSHDIIPPVTGYNGAPLTERCILSAKNDRDALLSWLSCFVDSKNTYSSYAKEVDRFYRWMHTVKNRPVSLMTHEDFQEYRVFLKNPTPEDFWVSNRKLPRTNKDWRPFFGPLMDSSIKQTVLILDTLFSWLVQSGYLHGNPISLASKRDRKSSKKRIQRYLTGDTIAEIHKLFDDISNQNMLSPVSANPLKKVYEPGSKVLARCRWIFTALFLTGMRISELACASTGNIEIRHINGKKFSWLTIIGKGRVERSIPLTDEFFVEYSRYRESLELKSEINQNTPLVFSIQKNREVQFLSRSTIHRIVKLDSQILINFLNNQGRFDEALKIKNFSAHWLRHSYATALFDSGAEQRTVKENLGHKSFESTTIYTHKDDVQRFIESQIIISR